MVLIPVNRSLALLAPGWGLIENASLVVVTLSDFTVLRILSGAGYLNVFEPDRLQALARLSVGTHADAYNVGLVLAGLRSPAFLYLWFKSDFIPRALAASDIFASFLMGRAAFFAHHLFRACESSLWDLWRSYLPVRTDNGLVAPAEGTTTFRS